MSDNEAVERQNEASPGGFMRGKGHEGVGELLERQVGGGGGGGGRRPGGARREPREPSAEGEVGDVEHHLGVQCGQPEGRGRPGTRGLRGRCQQEPLRTRGRPLLRLLLPPSSCWGGGSKRQRRALGGRRRRRGYIGPSIVARLEVFDETEESDFQESETETDNGPGHESDVEGAVGYSEAGVPDDPTSSGLLAAPAGAGIRRASIVTCDSRAGDIHTTPDPVKVAVFGADGVGKSALIVRLLTGRFIGEYDPTMEAVYSYQFPLPGHDLPLQVMDTAGKVEVVEEGRERQVAWGEGFLLVFSLVSHASFLALARLRRVILELTPGSPRPMVLVGNKADLSHAREVSDREIRDLADCWGCDYFEVAAPEAWEGVVRPFSALYHAVLENRDSH
ncbi:uncharacterized protein [Panulirus ornatus]|uniref:uncharacterized protein n=1 Tax=Panulirus ornatus TaxID=150431 RepID=UPI003A86651C